MYDKPENKQLSRRERILLDPLDASNRSDAEKKKRKKHGPFYGYKPKHDNFYPELDD